MKTMLAAAALALALPSMAFASTADVAGAWNITLTTPQGALPVTCTLTQAVAAVSGTCGGGMMASAPATGTVTDADFTLVYDVEFSGSPLHVVYTGRLQPDGAIAGTFVAGPYAGTFSGTKATAAVPAVSAP